MTSNITQFSLAESYLTPLFPFCPKGITLDKCVQLCLNQTLLRDGFYAAWAMIHWNSATGNYDFVITSPDPKADVTPYATVFPAWLKAVGLAVNDYNTVFAKQSPPPPPPPANNGVGFLSPFGLAMINTRSVQLLHYPPAETLTYMDYLYSPTNRRWESLLVFNGSSGYQNTLLETITDLVPIAANGGGAGATAISPWMKPFAFSDYVPQMLNVFLRATPGGKSTQPIVGHGSPVMSFLETAYSPTDISPVVKSIPGKLQPLSLFLQQFIPNGPKTPVLCANHPSVFMYYPQQEQGMPPTDWKLVLRQDLTAARWQIQMAANPDADPVATLKSAWAYWQTSSAFDAIFAEQISEFTRPASAPALKLPSDKPRVKSLAKPAAPTTPPPSPAKAIPAASTKPAAKKAPAPAAKKAAPAKSRR